MLDRNYFPQYGRVAIIDDHKEEVEGLMTLLYKNAIPFIYLENVPENFCELNCDGFRIVFLDLVLSGSSDEKTVKSLLYANLNGLLKENNGPCTIAIWSTKVEHYKQQLKEVLVEINCKSCDVIYLDKTKYKDYDADLIENFEIHFAEEFKKSTMLQFVSLWENTINHSMIDVAYKFDKVLPKSRKYDRGGHFASNLARLVLDKKLTEEGLNNEQKLFAAYEGINTLLNKESNMNINNLVSMSKDIIDVTNPDPKVNDIEINTLLWIADKYAFPYPKNVYKIDSIDSYLTRFFVNSDVSDENNIFVIIDITHKCSFAQNRTPNEGHQFVYGILFANGNYNENKKFPFSLYIKKIKYCKQEYDFCVLLNSIIYKNEEDIIIGDAIFSISDDVYSEIRTNISSLYLKSGKQEL